MGTLYSPQSQAGVMSFYDAPSKGPKLNPKIVLIVVIIFGIAIILVDRLLAL